MSGPGACERTPPELQDRRKQRVYVMCRKTEADLGGCTGPADPPKFLRQPMILQMSPEIYPNFADVSYMYLIPLLSLKDVCTSPYVPLKCRAQVEGGGHSATS